MLDKDWVRVSPLEARWHKRSKWYTHYEWGCDRFGDPVRKRGIWCCGIYRYRYYKRNVWKLVNVDGLATFVHTKERAVAKKLIATEEDMPVRQLFA